jgi:hypothetical protein
MHSEVHDNHLYAYVVDCENQRIVLHTVFRDREPHEFTDVVFHGVCAHHFEQALPGNILFDVEEIDVDVLVRENASLFEASWRYAWPPIEYRGDLATLTAALRGASIRAYSVSSSLGLSGWVLARTCERYSRGVGAAAYA